MSNQTATRPVKVAESRMQQASNSAEASGEDFYDLVCEVSDSVQRYCQRRPKVVGGIIFSIGFVLGWRMRPW